LKSSKGFITLQLCGYVALGMGVAMLGLGAFAKIQTSRLDAVKAEYAAFVLKVKTLGEEAQKKAKAKETADIKLKERTDADHKNTVARLNRDIKRMRDDHARSSIVPAAPAGSSRVDLACFDRTDFAGALRDYEAAVEGLIGEGAASALDLNAAKTWAQSQVAP